MPEEGIILSIRFKNIQCISIFREIIKIKNNIIENKKELVHLSEGGRLDIVEEPIAQCKLVRVGGVER